jgi:hypothetical protein
MFVNARKIDNYFTWSCIQGSRAQRAANAQFSYTFDELMFLLFTNLNSDAVSQTIKLFCRDLNS